jgi:hypothetical protein
VNNQVARKCTAGLRFYLMQESNEDGAISVLEIYPEFIQLHTIKKTLQITIRSVPPRALSVRMHMRV